MTNFVPVEEDPLDRELQSTELARIMAASYPRPVIFLGYVVTKPHAKRRESLASSSPFSVWAYVSTSKPVRDYGYRWPRTRH